MAFFQAQNLGVPVLTAMILLFYDVSLAHRRMASAASSSVSRPRDLDGLCMLRYFLMTSDKILATTPYIIVASGGVTKL